MSVQTALGFVAAVRERPDLAEQVESLGRDVTLDSLVEIGARAGFVFGAEHLRAAHRADWAMRWVRYSGNDSSG